MEDDKLPASLSDAQLEIMQVIWDKEQATVSEVWEALAQRRPLARNTVQTMITRLEEKGWLRHRAAGKTFLYSATVPRKTTLGQLVQQLVDTAFAGSAEGLVHALLDARGLTSAEAQRIRALLDAAERQRNAGKPRPQGDGP
jgi:predicted transcriptional regulator